MNPKATQNPAMVRGTDGLLRLEMVDAGREVVLDPLAELVWDLSDGLRSFEDLAQAASRAFDRVVPQEEVFSALDFLADASLIEARVAPPVAEGKVSRRSLLVQIAPVVGAGAFMMLGASARAGGLFQESAGKESSGKESSGKESSRKESNSKESAGKESNTKESTGKRSNTYESEGKASNTREYESKEPDRKEWDAKDSARKDQIFRDAEKLDGANGEYNNREKIDHPGKYELPSNHHSLNVPLTPKVWAQKLYDRLDQLYANRDPNGILGFYDSSFYLTDERGNETFPEFREQLEQNLTNPRHRGFDRRTIVEDVEVQADRIIVHYKSEILFEFHDQRGRWVPEISKRRALAIWKKKGGEWKIVWVTTVPTASQVDPRWEEERRPR